MPPKGFRLYSDTCNVYYCENPYYAKGYCKMHYVRHLLGTVVDRPLNVRNSSYLGIYANAGPCQFPGCDGKAHSAQYCSAHYNQMLRVGEENLKPIKRHSVRKKDENGQQCRTCMEYLPYSSFYNRSKGQDGAQTGYQTECKECQKKRHRRNREARAARGAGE